MKKKKGQQAVFIPQPLQFPSDGGVYLSSTVVVVIEFVKIAACLIAIIGLKHSLHILFSDMCVVAVSDGGLSGLKMAIVKDIINDPITTMKVQALTNGRSSQCHPSPRTS